MQKKEKNLLNSVFLLTVRSKIKMDIIKPNHYLLVSLFLKLIIFFVHLKGFRNQVSVTIYIVSP